MSTWKHYILGFVLALASASAPHGVLAQDIVHTRYTTDRGLPSEVLFDILQGHDGHIWVATDNGIARFDGFRFQVFEPTGLNTPSATWIKNLTDGRLVAYSFDGTLIVSDGVRMRPFLREITGNIPIPTTDPFIITQLGLLALINQYDFLLINPQTAETVLKFQIPITVPLNYPLNPVELQDGTLVVFYANMVWFIDPGTQQITTKPAILPDAYTAEARISQDARLLVVNGELTLLIRIGSQLTLLKYADESWVEHPYQTAISEITTRVVSITEADEGRLYFSTYNGVFVLEVENNRYTTQQLFENLPVNKFLRDNEGGYWISTNSNGLLYIRNRYSRIWQSGSKTTPDGSLNRLFVQGSTVYAGNALGFVGKLQTETGRWRWYNSGGLRFTESVFATSDHAFILTGADGLRRINAVTSDVEVLFNASYKSIVQFKNGDLLVATNAYSGIISREIPRILPPESASLTRLTDLSDGLLTEYRIRQVRSSLVWLEDEYSTFWVNYQDDLIRYQNGSETAIRFNGSVINATAFVRTDEGTIWIGTRFSGLYAYAPDGTLQHFNETDGLLSNRVTALVANGDSVWVGTNRGIQLFTIPFAPQLVLSSASGLASSEVNDMVMVGDNLYLSGSNGLQEIPIRSIERSTVPPVVFIDSIRVNGENNMTGRDIRIQHHEFPLEIAYSGINFSSGNQLRFAYRLIGLSDEWVQTTAFNTMARFFTLPPGSYLFEVKTVNGDGLESIIPATFSLRVYPPYYQAAWFWLLIVAMLFGGGYAFVQYRENGIRQRAQLEQERQSLAQALRISQLSAIKAQMNPHFIFNALNSIQSFIFSNDRISANLYLGKFADLMRMILKLSNESTISLQDEIRSLELYLDLEKIRFKKQMSFEIDIDPEVDDERIRIPSMLIQPYVENAVKHGLLHKNSPGRVIIRFRLGDAGSTLCIEIEDDGVGRRKSGEIQKRKERSFGSFATGANAQRLDLLNMGSGSAIGVDIIDLYHTVGQAMGTLVKLRIPIQHNE